MCLAMKNKERLREAQSLRESRKGRVLPMWTNIKDLRRGRKSNCL